MRGGFSISKKQDRLTYKKLHGEAKSAGIPSWDQWLAEVWPDLCQQFDPRQMWNADETGLYYTALPEGITMLKDDYSKGEKKRKEMLTALAVRSMTGEKRKLNSRNLVVLRMLICQ